MPKLGEPGDFQSLVLANESLLRAFRPGNHHPAQGPDVCSPSRAHEVLATGGRVRSMMDILRELTPLQRAVCSLGYDRAASILCEELPFRVISVPDSNEHNGWRIPPSWDVEEARIEQDGRLLYDGNAHPLGVIALSASFTGRVDRDELRRHLHYDHRYQDAIPFHYRQQFRSWERDWGFCVPRRVFDQLSPGEYDVVVRTRESAGVLKILEYKHRGALDTTIVLGANLDHAGVANDGLSGCAVGLEVMRRLRGRATRFTYALVLSPGIIGSEFYLAGLSQVERDLLLEGVFLEMLGSATPLALQESRHSMVSLSRALRSSLERAAHDHRIGPFQSMLVNDEYIWENYGIPMLSLSRFPYPEYHSSLDTVERIRERSLDEAVDLLMEAIDRVESAPLLVRRFTGNICLSNPRFDLYVDAGQVALGDSPSESRDRMRRLMDLIPALQRPVSVDSLADTMGLPLEETLTYLRKWEEKGLVDLL
jgi:aminopeptidase-like protein